MMHHCELLTSFHFVQIVEEYSNALPVSLVPFIAAIYIVRLMHVVLLYVSQTIDDC